MEEGDGNVVLTADKTFTFSRGWAKIAKKGATSLYQMCIPNHPFSVPENARRGGKEFLEVLIN